MYNIIYKMKRYNIIQNGGKTDILKIREHINGLNVINLNICKDMINNKKIDEYLEMIGSGFQAIIYLLNIEKCGYIVIKKYLEEKKNEMYRELNGLIFVKTLITRNICPHYLYMYDYNKEDGTILFEYVDGDIKKLYKNFSINLSDEFIYSFFFQILYGILCEYEMLNLLHLDLLPNNILKKSINKNKVFIYTINDKQYIIPTYGNLFLISDYGRCYKVKKKKKIMII